MSNTTKTPVAIAVGTILAGGLALSGSAFAMHSLAQGYMLSAQETTAAAQEAVNPLYKSNGMEGTNPMSDAGRAAHTMTGMDTDKDGKLSKAEFAAAHDGSDAKFAAHDPDGDGFISTAEMDAHHAADAGKKKGMEGKCGGSM
ncbi:MAG: hypothetical protein LH470_11645 [Lysobacter sp.]|nr:hypothetical protein [Lysobacter sp.]